MSKYLNTRRLTVNVFGYQLLIAIALGLIGLAFNRDVAISLVLGAGISAIAQLAFALIALRPKLGQSAGIMLAAISQAAIVKLLLAAVLLAVGFWVFELLRAPQNATALILAYVINQLAVGLMSRT